MKIAIGDFMLINKFDNVEINLNDSHKYALCNIKSGENVIKYGNPIGYATTDIKKVSIYILTI